MLGLKYMQPQILRIVKGEHQHLFYLIILILRLKNWQIAKKNPQTRKPKERKFKEKQLESTMEQFTNTTSRNQKT